MDKEEKIRALTLDSYQQKDESINTKLKIKELKN